MKKLINQDLLILLSLVGAYHPKVAEGIECEAQKLTMQETRDYLFLLRDDQCCISPFFHVFRKEGREYDFWMDAPGKTETICALHLHINRMARDSPKGSVIMLNYYGVRHAIEKISTLNEQDRQLQIAKAVHSSLTRTQQCSTLDFISWLKGGN